MVYVIPNSMTQSISEHLFFSRNPDLFSKSRSFPILFQTQRLGKIDRLKGHNKVSYSTNRRWEAQTKWKTTQEDVPETFWTQFEVRNNAVRSGFLEWFPNSPCPIPGSTVRIRQQPLFRVSSCGQNGLETSFSSLVTFSEPRKCFETISENTTSVLADNERYALKCHTGS